MQGKDAVFVAVFIFASRYCSMALQDSIVLFCIVLLCYVFVGK